MTNHQHIIGSMLQGQPRTAGLLLLPALLVPPPPYLRLPYLPR
ncbi:hypothetical protein OV203_43425 [Nannocystis sp. ILAH1]|nr:MULTISPECIES: hypothetical protein [unclassified Nannocystis]MCY0994059.1 hypothetical protein [Nannocystis sp. ILAH1]MCY1067028.1 hypothetical protein [Nannocystis sp. RBIL2]